MKKKKVGLIRAMTINKEQCTNLEKKLEDIFPELEIRTKSIPEQPQGVYDGKSYSIAEPKVVAAALELEKEGVMAIVINCAADPGVKKARETLKIPIIGAGSTSALITKSMGLPVGIIGVFAEPLIAVEEVLGSLLVDSIRPDKVITALDFSNTEVIESIKNAGILLKEKGARCILITCTAMSLIGIAPYLNEQLGIPVIDPLMSTMDTLNRIVTCKTFIK